jgi:hypothetical protein
MPVSCKTDNIIFIQDSCNRKGRLRHPPRGRTVDGGLRIGEMEPGALVANGAVQDILARIQNGQ